MADDIQEMGALVVSFLQGAIQDNPHGFSIHDFERKFPSAVDEPRDWYKRYGKKSTLEALEAIQDSIIVRFDERYNSVFISLNRNAKGVSNDLIDLISKQKQSNKKKGFRPSHRALATRSFSLNRQHPGDYQRRNFQPNRLNYDQQYKGDQFIRRRSPTPPTSSVSRPPSIYDRQPPSKYIAANDPRQNRSSNAGLMVPPQVRVPMPQLQHSPRPSVSSPVVQSQPPAQPPSESSTMRIPIPQRPAVAVPEKRDEPEMVAKKEAIGQRLVYLLMRRSAEIKIFHLNSLYQLEFSEHINWKDYGHDDLGSLLKDPIIREFIQINFRNSMPTISIRSKTSDKENVENGHISNGQTKKDPFNLKPLQLSLEPQSQVKKPPLASVEIDNIVKYKTMRMILQNPEQMLKLEDWEREFELKNRLKISFRDFGCETILDFFKRLARDIPIRVDLFNGIWTAVADLERLSPWLKERMDKNQYRAITAIDGRFEMVAFPDDTYTYTDIKDIMDPSYQPVQILSAKRADSLWIQLKTSKRIEDHLCVETSLTSYEEIQKQKPPHCFIRPGLPCAVLDRNQQRWCRGLVLKVEKKGENYEANTLLVDYGLERSYAISELWCLMKAHLKFPVGSIYSKLHGVQEEKLNSIIVQRRAKMILQEYTNPPVTLACKFVDSSPAPKNPAHLPSMCVAVTLVDTRQGKDCNLSDDINQPRDSPDNDDGSETPTTSEPKAMPDTIRDQ